MAAEKKEPVSKRAYKNSPRLERKEDGKLGVSKKAKESEKEQAGTDGMEVNGSPEMDVRHSKERLILHHKHEIDHAEMEAKHTKEKLSEMKGK